MPLRLTCLVLYAWLFLVQAPAGAILIQSGKLRVGGYLEREDDKQIVVRIKTRDGKEKVEVFDASKVKVIHRVDLERLKQLIPTKPKAYRDYADELAIQTSDPEGIDMALRLYLIAAYLDSPNLGRGCLWNMSALATRPADVRKYRAMAFVLDAKSDQALLKTEVAKATPSTSPASKASLKALTEFQKALKLYRTGQIKAARDYANDKGVADYFGKSGMKDQKTFLQACNDATCSKCKDGNLNCTVCLGKGKVVDAFGAQLCTSCNGKGKQKCATCDGSGLNPYPEEYLNSVLRAEIWALDLLLGTESTAKKGADAGWSNAVNSPPTPIPSLTLESITEYDPRKCVFRNGTWELP